MTKLAKLITGIGLVIVIGGVDVAILIWPGANIIGALIGLIALFFLFVLVVLGASEYQPQSQLNTKQEAEEIGKSKQDFVPLPWQ